MKTDSYHISKVFSNGGDIHYLLPHFQREYTWDKPQWQTLFDDALALHDELGALSTARNSDITDTVDDEAPTLPELEHFLGALVVINDTSRGGIRTVFKLVDGQQRLTSISLLLCALAKVAGHQDSLNRRVRKLLVNRDEEGDLFYKLLPTVKYGDRSAYTAILQSEPVPEPCASRIPQAFEFFVAELQGLIGDGTLDPARFFHVLTESLQVVFIDLNRDESPYRIFESLNGKGKPLTQADLVRNYIAMRLPAANQEKVFEKHWAKVEGALQEQRFVGRIGELTAFLRHYLAMRTGILCSEKHVYARFRDRAEREFASDVLFAGEIETLARFAGYYDKLLRPSGETDIQIREGLERLAILEFSTAFPFLLAVFDAYHTSALTRDDVLGMIAALENYLVRRMLAGEATNFLNKVFSGLWAHIDPTDAVNSLKAHLATRGYPSDTRIRAALATRSLYDKSELTRNRTNFILESVNRFLSLGSGGYTVLSASPTIEHVLPQSLSMEWRAELGGDNPEETHRELLHTLGNLTLVTQDWNSSLSNASFGMKQSKLAVHALKLNADYFGRPDVAKWNSDAIRSRTTHLAGLIVAIWPTFVPKAATTTSAANGPSVSNPSNFNQEVVERVGKYLGFHFFKHRSGQITYATSDGQARLVVTVSKNHERDYGKRFWFGFHPTHKSFLEESQNAYIAFGCGSADSVVLFPFADFAPFIANMGTTTQNGRFYYHVEIKQRPEGLFLSQSVNASATQVEISSYLMPT